MDQKCDILIKNVDKDKKIKAMYVLKKNKKNVTSAVRELIDGLAEQYDENK